MLPPQDFRPYDTARVVSALATVGLDGSLARRRVERLSGGQMRRVVIAGLLARWPKALILDEPLAGLDAATSRACSALDRSAPQHRSDRHRHLP